MSTTIAISGLFDLLEQHDDYRLDDHLSLGRLPGHNWFIYWDCCEIHCRTNPKAPMIGFPTVREALIYIQTSRGIAALAAVDPSRAPSASLPQPAPARPAETGGR